MMPNQQLLSLLTYYCDFQLLRIIMCMCFPGLHSEWRVIWHSKGVSTHLFLVLGALEGVWGWRHELALKSVCSRGQPWTLGPPASTTQVLGLQVSTSVQFQDMQASAHWGTLQLSIPSLALDPTTYFITTKLSSLIGYLEYKGFGFWISNFFRL